MRVCREDEGLEETAIVGQPQRRGSGEGSASAVPGRGAGGDEVGARGSPLPCWGAPVYTPGV